MKMTRVQSGTWRFRTPAIWVCLALAGCTGPLRRDTARPSISDPNALKQLSPAATAQPVDRTTSNIGHSEPDKPGEPVIRGASQEFNVLEPMALDDALVYTLDHHPMLRARHYEIDVAKGALVGAGLMPNPQLVLQTGTPVGSPSIGEPTQLLTRVMFTFPTCGKICKREAVARAGIVRASFALRTETQTVLQETAAAGLEVLYYRELIDLQKELTGLAEIAADIQKKKVDAGQATEVEALLAEIDSADVQFDRLKTEASLEAARLRLARAMGIDPPRPVDLKGKLDVELASHVDLETLLLTAQQSRPELGGARAAVAESERALALAHAEAVPDFSFGPRVQDDLENASDHSVGARFSTDLALFDRKQGDIAQSAAQIRANRALFDNTRLTSLNDVAAAFVQLRPIEQSLRHYNERITPLAARTEEAIRVASATQIIDAYRMSLQLRKLGQIRLSELQLRYLHNQTRVKLELYLGQHLAELGTGPKNTEPVAPGQEELQLPQPRKTTPQKPQTVPRKTTPDRDPGRTKTPDELPDEQPLPDEPTMEDDLPDMLPESPLDEQPSTEKDPLDEQPSMEEDPLEERPIPETGRRKPPTTPATSRSSSRTAAARHTGRH